MQKVTIILFFLYVACETKHMMELFSYYAWYSISFLLLFLFHRLYK
jgi:hypothetical protein